MTWLRNCGDPEETEDTGDEAGSVEDSGGEEHSFLSPPDTEKAAGDGGKKNAGGAGGLETIEKDE